MCSVRRTAVVTLILVGSALAAVPVYAQGDPDQARFRVGSLAVSPMIRLNNVGWDSNIYNRDTTDSLGVEGDATAGISPLVQLWVRSPRVQMTARSQLDYIYYRELTSLRTVDADQSGQIELTLNRLQPFVSGSFITTRHRQNLEIDAIARRRTDTLQGGTSVRLTSKTSIRLYAGRSRFEYETGAVFDDVDLSRALNQTGTQQGLALEYRLTPLTTFAIDVERGQTSFDVSTERNSESLRIGPSVAFKPLALISGRASLSWRSITFEGREQPDFRSSVASVDLQYTFRGRTQFTVSGTRDFEYSYRETQADYVLAGFYTTATQRIGQRWDVVGGVGRYGLSYRPKAGAIGQLSAPSDTVVNLVAGLGYRLGRHRVALDVQRNARTSELDGRSYRRIRVFSSLTYLF